MKFPGQCAPEKEHKKDYIYLEHKKCGVWDLINLGNKGGIFSFSDNFALEVRKTDQKWCNLYLIMYSKGIEPISTTFNSQKVVKDDSLIRELKTALKASNEREGMLNKQIKKMQSDLAQYKVNKTSSVGEEVYEL